LHLQRPHITLHQLSQVHQLTATYLSHNHPLARQNQEDERERGDDDRITNPTLVVLHQIIGPFNSGQLYAYIMRPLREEGTASYVGDPAILAAVRNYPRKEKMRHGWCELTIRRPNRRLAG
jgi:hypothetical protein